MCIYRNVIRSLASATFVGSTLFGIAVTSSAQPLAHSAAMGMATSSPIELVASGRTLLWTHESGETRALYTASAPGYAAAKVDGGGGAGVWDLAEMGPASPDGAWVLYLRDGLLYRLATDEGIASGLATSEPLFATMGVITHAAWSPDGTRIAFVMLAPKARSAGEAEIGAIPSFIGVFDLATGRRWFLSPAIEHDSSPVWSADGSEIFFQRSTGRSLAADIPRHDGAEMTDAQSDAILIGDVESGAARVIWTAADGVALIGPHAIDDDGAMLGGIAGSLARAGTAPRCIGE